jgi:ferritin
MWNDESTVTADKRKDRQMMISEAMNANLNDQIAMELSAAYSYLAMSCALDDMGLKVMGERFMKQHDEEHEHAMKILKYVQEVGGKVKLAALPEPKTKYDSLKDVVKHALESEEKVTKAINDLVALAEKEDDYATRSFLTWFVDEQVEEVSSMRDLLDVIKLAGDHVLQVEAYVRQAMGS